MNRNYLEFKGSLSHFNLYGFNGGCRLKTQNHCVQYQQHQIQHTKKITWHFITEHKNNNSIRKENLANKQIYKKSFKRKKYKF